MDNFVILADVTCDLSQEIRDFCKMEEYIPGFFQISDGRDFHTALDWDNISRGDFYKTLANKKNHITTAPPSQEAFYLKYKEYVEKGYKILAMSISSKISSTYNSTCMAAKRLKEEYPDCTIHCCDSFRMSGAFGLLVFYAHILKNEGKSFEEVVDWVESNKKKVHMMGPIDDLIFVARRGNITMGKAIMGNFAGVKPMGDCSADGYVSVLTKVKGINKTFDITVKYLEKMATDIQNQYLIISHSDREAYAENLKAKIIEKLNPKKVFITDVFPACGANIGSGMLSVNFLGDEISDDNSTEKEIINEIVNNMGK